MAAAAADPLAGLSPSVRDQILLASLLPDDEACDAAVEAALRRGFVEASLASSVLAHIRTARAARRVSAAEPAVPSSVPSTAASDWGSGTARGEEGVAAATRESSSSSPSTATPLRPSEPPSLTGANWAVAAGTPEVFLLSSYPFDGADAFWRGVLRDGVRVGVQLASAAPGDYHIRRVGDRRDDAEGLVELEAERRPFGRIVERTYRVVRAADGRSWRLVHFEMPWTDFGLPDPAEFDALLGLYEDCVSALASEAAPVIQVHCMGGIGRTGTFVLTRVLRSQRRAGLAEPPEAVLATLRAQRRGLVETAAQLRFAEAHSR